MGRNGTPNLELTTAQKNCLGAYRKHVDKFGAPPSLRELALALGLAHSSARHLLQELERRGYLVKKPITVMRLRLSPKGRKIPL